MIIGQETNSWGGEMYGESELQTPENLMNLYDIFVNIDRGYNSPYWLLEFYQKYTKSYFFRYKGSCQ